MRNYNKTIGALAAITALTAGVASAEIEGNIYGGYATQYNFRGVNNGDDLAEAGVNISTACPLTAGTLSAGLWYGSMNDDQTLINNQLNATVGLNKDFGAFNLGLGYIRYDYDNTAGSLFDDTSEIYVSASTEVYQGIRASVTAFADIEAANGWYFETTLSKSIKLQDNVSLDLVGGASFYESYAGTKGGFNHYFLSAAVAWTPKENFTITPYVKFTSVADGQFSGLDNHNGLNEGDEELFGGVRASVSF